jgi:hypothetical protein
MLFKVRATISDRTGRPKLCLAMLVTLLLWLVNQNCHFCPVTQGEAWHAWTENRVICTSNLSFVLEIEIKLSDLVYVYVTD